MNENSKKVRQVENEILLQKEKILSGSLDDPQQRQAFQQLRELVLARNAIAEFPIDLRYLIVDDNESFSMVAGFIGDDTGLVDEDGLHLHVGDVVSLLDGDTAYNRMILLGKQGKPIFSQKELDAKKALRIDCFSEEYLKSAAACICFEVTLHDCLGDTIEQQHMYSISMG